MCPYCGSTDVRWADQLGQLHWAECRHCGMVYSKEYDNTDEGSR